MNGFRHVFERSEAVFSFYRVFKRVILGQKMGLGGHLGGRLGGQCKTKCIDWVDIWVDTFNIVLTTFTPLIRTKKSGLMPFFIVLPPPLFHKTGGIIPRDE
nr:MAG TPA: hypothetical protein [Caudoviricetes sp.]